jgi:hypothetical protein
MRLDSKVHPEAGREFAVRYYRWAVEQWRAEVLEDLPTLRSITCVPALDLHAFEPLAPSDRLAVGLAFAKRNNREAMAVLGETLLPEDKLLIKEHLQRSNAELYRWMWGGFRAGDPRDAWHHTMTARRPARAVAELRKEVRKAVEPVLGSDVFRFDPNSWRYRTQVGRWALLTEIFFRTDQDLAYSHDIRFGNESESMCRCISAMDWLVGTGKPLTGWTLSSANDIPAVVASLASVCRRFVEAAPALLPT